MNPILHRLFRAPVHLYRWHCGWLLGRRFLLLIHIGRRTRRRHETVLDVMESRPHGPEFIVMSGWGRDADWLRNIAARPEAWIIVGTRTFEVTCRLLEFDEAERVVSAYEHRHRWTAPVIRAVLRRLLDWKYDGSDEARRRLVAQLPIVAFRSRGGHASEVRSLLRKGFERLEGEPHSPFAPSAGRRKNPGVRYDRVSPLGSGLTPTSSESIRGKMPFRSRVLSWPAGRPRDPPMKSHEDQDPCAELLDDRLSAAIVP